MAAKEMQGATPTTTTVEGEKTAPVMTTTTIARAVEVVISGLQGHRYLNLTTFRKTGVPVVTTVWFVPANDKLYVWTAKDSGKVKRIRNNAKVQIAPSTRLGRPRGPVATATARILSSTEQAEVQQEKDDETQGSA